jgi:hypothetical protein
MIAGEHIPFHVSAKYIFVDFLFFQFLEEEDLHVAE